MPIDAAKVMQVHADIRAFFKGQLKSCNKVYLQQQPANLGRDAAWQAKAQRRNENAVLAFDTMVPMWETHKGDSKSLVPLARAVLRQQQMRAGNCTEMALAAAFLVLQRGLGSAWLGVLKWPGDHTFCLVSFTVPPTRTCVWQFAYEVADLWIIDPWANVCCPVRAYEQAVLARFKKWNAHGKSICVTPPDRDDSVFCDPLSEAFTYGFLNGAIHYMKLPALSKFEKRLQLGLG